MDTLKSMLILKRASKHRAGGTTTTTRIERVMWTYRTGEMMYSILKDFAGPIATVIAAAAASYVAYHFGLAQNRTANENLRATKQRVVLDLFD